MLPNASLLSTLSRAFIHPRLPRMVLISPLWAKSRKGCASDHVGNVLVLKRECISARPLVRYGFDKSGKYCLSPTDDSMPLYTMQVFDSEQI